MSLNAELAPAALERILVLLQDSSLQEPLIFEPEPGVLYESSYSIIVRTDDGLVMHTTTNETLAEIKKLLTEAIR